MYGNYEDVCDYNSNTVENFALSDYCNYDSRSQDQRDCFAGYFAGKSGSSNNCGNNAPCNAGYAGGQTDRSKGGFQVVYPPMMENPDK